METAPLKSFATSARAELIREVGARIIAVLAQGSPERVEQPKAVSALERVIAGAGGGDMGKAHVTDKVAYTWFNRIIALRFMDANGYTGIGVVSPATGQVGQPEVLAAAKRGQVDEDVVRKANSATIIGLLNGTRQPRPGVDAQAEAYTLLLADYCRFWNAAMPFMFEREGDYTELLMPANLLADDSVLSRSIEVLTKDVCQDVEVIGWLYQFYISERKQEVFDGFKKNRKAGADEIPAATQLFTPHWIVRYLVENSLGRLWMLNRPSSGLANQMDYYVGPEGEEADFLKITKPEELKVIDPACGSGHMLTYAFDLLYAIYEEEGYAPSQIPGLILENNLYGTEIDPRAGALAAFALTMKASAKRRLFLKNPVQPNVCVLGRISFGADELSYLLTAGGDRQAEEAFWNQFAEADTFGSLIRPDPALVPRLSRHLQTIADDGDIYKANALDGAREVIRQAKFLEPRYSVVVANPPYMGSATMNSILTEFARNAYSESKSDLFAMFIERSIGLVEKRGFCAMVTMQSWMFLASYEELRRLILKSAPVQSLLHLGAGAFDTIGGAVVSTSAFVLQRNGSLERPGFYIDLTEGRSEAEKSAQLHQAIVRPEGVYKVLPREFLVVPRSPLTYALNERAVFGRPNLGAVMESGGRLKTHGNAKYVRYHWEVAASAERWRAFHNGGGQAAYYGNDEEVVDWSPAAVAEYGRHGGLPKAATFDAPGVTWSMVGSVENSFRVRRGGELFSSASPTLVTRSEGMAIAYCAALNTPTMAALLRAINPTINNYVADVVALPQLSDAALDSLQEIGEDGMVNSRARAALSESSRLFAGLGILGHGTSIRAWIQDRIKSDEAVLLRERNFRVHAEKVVASDFGVTPRPVSSAKSVTSEYAVERVRDLISFAIGCIFGRYSLDEPGLILADQGMTVQDYLSKVPAPSFTPDADNVIPVVAGDWFEDDVAALFRRFLRTAFGDQHFEENLKFVTESLCVKSLRDYFITKAGKSKFYDDHVQRYKKRPIYWLFSSPRGSFNALVYMHRYTSSTASTVLTYLREYVTKMESALQLAERNGNSKEADRLRKILIELNEYERETLYPLASRKVDIDLDDGVKANYPKFGAALKNVKGLEASSD